MECNLTKRGSPLQKVFVGLHGSGTRVVSLPINKEFLKSTIDCRSTMKIFKDFQGKIFQLIFFFISKFFLGGSESSWDKDKIQSPLAAPGAQHGMAHAALTGHTSLGSAPTLNPLQQNHLLNNRKCTILTKLLVRKIEGSTF